MTDDLLLKTLQDDLGVQFIFDDTDKLMGNCASVLDELKQHVTDATELQLRNFNAQRDVIMKYRKEKNFKLNKQEKIILEKSTQLSEENEALKRAIHEAKAKIGNMANLTSDKLKQLEGLEMEEMDYLKKHDANTQSLEGVRKYVETQKFLYNNFLGIEIINQIGDQLQIEIKLDNKATKADCKIPVTRNNDGYVFPGGSLASTPSECMAKVCYERKKSCPPTSQI